jgi:hypothetical protein
MIALIAILIMNFSMYQIQNAHADVPPLHSAWSPKKSKPLIEATQVSGSGHFEGDTAKVIKRVLRRWQMAFFYCYQDALNTDPNLRGKLRSSWTIKETGETDEIKVLRGGLSSEKVTLCLVKRLQRVRFPKPIGGVVNVI